MDDAPNPYLIWKDTATVPVKTTADFLVDMSDPGTWMANCHIAEYVQSGMIPGLCVTGEDLAR